VGQDQIASTTNPRVKSLGIALPKSPIKRPARGSTGVPQGPRPHLPAGTTLPGGPQDPRPMGHRLGTMHVSNLRGAWEPSQTATYKLVIVALSFRGETRKSYLEQSLCAALMGRSNKEGSATDKESYVEPLPMALPHCFNDRTDRSCHVGRRIAPLIKASHR
jgi:hypothetical protein